MSARALILRLVFRKDLVRSIRAMVNSVQSMIVPIRLLDRRTAERRENLWPRLWVDRVVTIGMSEEWEGCRHGDL